MREFAPIIEDDDVWDELKNRTQAKGESISDYVMSLRLIAGHFRYPATEDEFLRILYRGLTPEYRRYLSAHDVENVAEVERVLRRYERIKDIDRRYNPSPTKDKMRFPSADPRGTTKLFKLDALLEMSFSDSEKETSKMKLKKNKKSVKKTKKTATCEVENVDAILLSGGQTKGIQFGQSTWPAQVVPKAPVINSGQLE